MWILDQDSDNHLGLDVICRVITLVCCVFLLARGVGMPVRECVCGVHACVRCACEDWALLYCVGEAPAHATCFHSAPCSRTKNKRLIKKPIGCSVQFPPAPKGLRQERKHRGARGCVCFKRKHPVFHMPPPLRGRGEKERGKQVQREIVASQTDDMYCICNEVTLGWLQKALKAMINLSTVTGHSMASTTTCLSIFASLTFLNYNHMDSDVWPKKLCSSSLPLL